MEREGNTGPLGAPREPTPGELLPDRYRDEFFRETALRVRFTIRNLLGRHREAKDFLRDLRRAILGVPEARA